ncbi:MAG: ABC transporter ATP-binding protein [Acidimicrobiales bacterium]
MPTDHQAAAPIIRTAGLRKSFGDVVALDGLDLTVRAGEVHGFLGPNGSGKSTTIRVLLGLVRASGGEAELFRGDPWRDAVSLHSRLAYVPGDVSLWPGLTGGECLDILASSHGGLRPQRRAEMIDRFDLDPSRKSQGYSKGNRQKVALVAALAVDAELLILDEPTSGLDPLMEQVFQAIIRERRAEGCTILLSSHVLAEVESLADRVSIIRQGSTVMTGTLAELRRHTRTLVHAVTRSAPDGIREIDGVVGLDVESADSLFDIKFAVDVEHLDGAIGVLHAAGLHALTATPPSLDEVFRRAYEDESSATTTTTTRAPL